MTISFFLLSMIQVRDSPLGVASCLLQPKTGVAKFTPIFDSGKNLGGYHGNNGPIKLMFTWLDQAYGSLMKSTKSVLEKLVVKHA